MGNTAAARASSAAATTVECRRRRNHAANKSDAGAANSATGRSPRRTSPVENTVRPVTPANNNSTPRYASPCTASSDETADRARCSSDGSRGPSIATTPGAGVAVGAGIGAGGVVRCAVGSATTRAMGSAGVSGVVFTGGAAGGDSGAGEHRSLTNDTSALRCVSSMMWRSAASRRIGHAPAATMCRRNGSIFDEDGGVLRSEVARGKTRTLLVQSCPSHQRRCVG